MVSPSPDDSNIPTGQLRPVSASGQYNALSFIIEHALAKMQTATLVRIEACTNSGDLSPVGFVDVLPLVNQIDGDGTAVEHAVIYNVPYCRIQGGTNGIIIDPEVGDIGICCFASRDISAVKRTKAKANPGSFRQFSFSDGMYIGGVLNGTPAQYMQFSANGIKIHSPNPIAIEAGYVTVNASEKAAITAPIVQLGASGQTLRALVTSEFQALFNAHTHNTNGHVSSPPNTQLGPDQLSTTVMGG